MPVLGIAAKAAQLAAKASKAKKAVKASKPKSKQSRKVDLTQGSTDTMRKVMATKTGNKLRGQTVTKAMKQKVKARMKTKSK